MERWDQERTAEAVRSSLPSVVRAAYACLKNRAEAEDVAQEVFLIPSGKALRRTGRGPPEGMAAEGHGQQMQEPAQKRLVPEPERASGVPARPGAPGRRDPCRRPLPGGKVPSSPFTRITTRAISSGRSPAFWACPPPQWGPASQDALDGTSSALKKGGFVLTLRDGTAIDLMECDTDF